MRFSALFPRRLILIALLAVAVGAPYAIPVPWLALTRWATGSTVENPGFLTAPVDNQSWFIIFGAICAGWVAILFYRKPDPGSDEIDQAPQRLLLFTGACWFIVTLLRGVTAPQFQSMYHDLLLQTAFFILFVVSALHGAKVRDLVLIQVILTVAVIPLAVLALVQNAGADPLAYSPVVPGTLEAVKGKHLIASTFGHPNYMGSYLAPVLIMATGLAASPLSWIWRCLGALSAVLAMLALVAGGTRGPLVAVAAGLLIFFIMTWRSGAYRLLSQQLGKVAAAGLATCILLGFALWMWPALRPSFNLFDRLFAGQEIASRAFYWIVGLEMFKSAPIFGIGIGQFDSQFWWQLSQMPQIELGGSWHFMVNSIVRGVRPGYMHNDHLQVLVETGLAGALAWSGLWAAVIIRCRQSGRDGSPSRPSPGSSWAGHSDLLNAAFVGAFAAVAVDAMFGFPFHLPCSGALFWIALGLWSGCRRISM